MNRDVEYEIRRNYKRLRPSERKVADHLLKMKESPDKLTMTGLANLTHVSQPTIMRFCNTIGCRGFKELKQRLMQDFPRRATAFLNTAEDSYKVTDEFTVNTENKSSSEASSAQIISSATNPAEISDTFLSPEFTYGKCKKSLDKVPLTVISTASKVLQDLLDEISPIEYKKLIHAMTHAGHVIIAGDENSGYAVEELSSKLKQLEIDCTSYNIHSFLALDLKYLSRNDIILYLSCTAAPGKTTKVLQHAAKSSATLAVLVNHHLPVMSKLTDIEIVTTPHASPYENSIYSLTSQLSLVEMIYAGILSEKTSLFV